MIENPYQSPTTDELEAPQATGIRVDGKYLVLPSGAVLPPYCARTGVPVGPEDMRKVRLTRISPLLALLFFLGGPLLFLLGYLLCRKNCYFTYGLAPQVRRRQRNRRFMMAGVAILMVVLFPVAVVAESPAFAVAWIIAMVVVLTVVWILDDPQIAIGKYRRGEFWIKGFSPEFLVRASQQIAAPTPRE